MLKIIIIGIVITVLSITAFVAVDKKKNASSSLINGQSTQLVDDANTSKVAISGEVNHPGDYVIATDKTLGDLIYMAGGVTTKADDSAYNSSLLISTRTEFYIAPIAEESSSCSLVEITKVNINTATEEELIEIGLSSSQASNLVSYRTDTGLFEALEDLLKVKGIGKATYAKIKNKVTIS